MTKKEQLKGKSNFETTIMNRDEREKFDRDEPNFQDEYQVDDSSAALDNAVPNDEYQKINRQLNNQQNSPKNEDDFDQDDDLDEIFTADQEDFADVDGDDLEKDGDLNNDDPD